MWEEIHKSHEETATKLAFSLESIQCAKQIALPMGQMMYPEMEWKLNLISETFVSCWRQSGKYQDESNKAFILQSLSLVQKRRHSCKIKNYTRAGGQRRVYSSGGQEEDGLLCSEE